MRVLIVDDNPPTRSLVAGVVEWLGGDVVGEAVDGDSAVAAAEALEPDVVVMDWMLPGMDGVEATVAIKARSPRVVVIGYSSALGDEVPRRFARAGASGFVHKADGAGLVAELTRRSEAAGDAPRAPRRTGDRRGALRGGRR